MDKLKEADFFATDPQFTVMGSETVSNWKTKLVTIIVILIALGASFSTIKGMFDPISQIPVITSFVSTDQIINPLIIGFNFIEQSDLGKTKIQYDRKIAEFIECPSNIKTQYSECFITPQINLTQSFIKISLNVSNIFSTFIEMFSINRILYNQSKSFYKAQYILDQSFIKVNSLQLLFQNAVIPRSSKIYTGILVDSITSLPTSYSTQQNVLNTNNNDLIISQTIACYIILSDNNSSIRYEIRRTTFLTAVSTFVSWMMTISSFAGILIIINIYIIKNHLIHKLYQSRHIQNRWLMIKIWIHDILQTIKLGRIFRKCGFFKKEYLISKSFREIDQQLSLDVIFRIMDYDKQNTREESQKLSDELSFDYDFKSEVKYTKYKALKQIFPIQQKGFIQTFLESRNMNPIKVKLLSKIGQKSSLFSIIITFVGIALIVPLLIYLGAFDKIPSISITTHLLNENEFQFNNFSNIYIDVYGQNNRKYQSNNTVIFQILNKDYHVQQSKNLSHTCKHNLSQTGEQQTSYCLSSPLKIHKNIISDVNSHLGIFVNNELQQYLKVKIRFVNYALKPDKIQQYITIRQDYLYLNQFYEAVLTSIQQQQNEKVNHLHYISMFKPIETPQALQQSAFYKPGFIISLSRQSHVYKIHKNPILTYLKNIWNLNYIFFTLLLTFIIFPYNNKLAKSNFISKIKNKIKQKQQQNVNPRESQDNKIIKQQQQNYELKQKRIFSVENMLQLLYSKFWNSNPSFPYVKKKL